MMSRFWTTFHLQSLDQGGMEHRPPVANMVSALVLKETTLGAKMENITLLTTLSSESRTTCAWILRLMWPELLVSRLLQTVQH